MNKKARKIDANIFRLIIIFILILAVAGITKGGNFMKISIFQTMGRQSAELGLMAIGCGLCMISGGIDLSCVYIANLAAISAGLMLQNEMSIPLAVIIAMIIGSVCGAFNGFLVAYLNIPPMLATLGSYQLFQGISVVISGGSSVAGSKTFAKIGSLNVGVIPLPFIVFLVVVIILSVVMGRTKFGTRVFLVGTNPKCSIFAGIKNKTILVRVYLISGLLSGMAGLLSLARINSAKADFGSSYTMQCILISVLGGINPNGGFGTIPGVAIAVLVLQVLSSYLNQFPDVSNYYRDFIWGAALLIVLILNFELEKRKTKKAMMAK